MQARVPPPDARIEPPRDGRLPPGGHAAPVGMRDEDLHREMSLQVGREEHLRAAERYREQRAMWRPLSHPVRFSPEAHRGLFARVRFAPATYYHRRDVFYAHYHYVPPPACANGMYPVYGIWDAQFLEFMLEHAADPAYALMYYNHQDDEGMQQWRADVDRIAVGDDDLKGKLGVLDEQVAALKGVPLDPSYVPEDAQDIALAPEVVEQMGGGQAEG